MTRILILLFVLLASPLVAEEAATMALAQPEGWLGKLNLSDPRLDPAGMKPVDKEAAAIGYLLVPGLYQVDAEGRAGDPKLDDATRKRLGEQVWQYLAALKAYDATLVEARRKDELYDAKVDAAWRVAEEYVRRTTPPRRECLPETRVYSFHDRLRYYRVTTAQAHILKAKYSLDWTPPPEAPRLEPFFIGPVR